MAYEKIAVRTPQDYIDNRHGANKFLIKEKPSSDSDKIKFWCVEGKHEFISSVTAVRLNKYPCNVCYPRMSKRTQEEAEREIASKGLKLLSKYTGSTKPHTFKCENGHVFERPFNSIFCRTPCLKCEKERKIREKKKIVLELSGGTINMTEYGSKRCKFKCDKEHTWEVIFGSFKVAPTCPVCANRVTKKTRLITPIEKFEEITKPKPISKPKLAVKPSALLNSIFK